MMNNCGNGFHSQFASIPGVAVWAVLPGALATLTSEVGIDLGEQVLGENICGLDIMFGEKEHAAVVLNVCLDAGPYTHHRPSDKSSKIKAKMGHGSICLTNLMGVNMHLTFVIQTRIV